jgi:hypothetical protein
MIESNVIILGLLIGSCFTFFLLIILTLTLDSKMWAKLDRVVNIILLERQEILKKIESLLTRIEELENKIRLG